MNEERLNPVGIEVIADITSCAVIFKPVGGEFNELRARWNLKLLSDFVGDGFDSCSLTAVVV